MQRTNEFATADGTLGATAGTMPVSFHWPAAAAISMVVGPILLTKLDSPLDDEALVSLFDAIVGSPTDVAPRTPCSAMAAPSVASRGDKPVSPAGQVAAVVLARLVAWLPLAAVLAAISTLAWRLVLCPPPPVFTPPVACAWPCCAGDADASGDEQLRCVQINMWSGSDYTLKSRCGCCRLLCGRLGRHESSAETDARFDALVAALRRLQPHVVAVNEAMPVGQAHTRGLCCHFALSFSVPIGILHINENVARLNDSIVPTSRPAG
jgi:hypothetical protein